MVKQQFDGFMVKTFFKCDMCGLKKTICNVPPDHINLNKSGVVMGQTIGIGHSQLEEGVSMFGLKAMCEKTWQKYATYVAKHTIAAAQKTMDDAATEERNHAVDNGQFENISFVPRIPVEGDGSYLKRSYPNSRYNSSGACVVLIGTYSGKVVDLEVIQKNCSHCDYAFSHGTEPDENHQCPRNHGVDESSTSMEKAGFVRMFARSISKNGLIYDKLISDGDSSNYAAILQLNPYREQMIMVENTLCVNHIRRNVSSNLKAFSKTKGLGTKLSKFFDNLGKAACAGLIVMVANINDMDVNEAQKRRVLAHNIRILKLHLLGDHSECAGNYFECDGEAKPGEENLRAEIIHKNLLFHYEECFVRAHRNVVSLLRNLTTNKSEAFNALISKCIEAKRVHWAKKLQYIARCNVAALNHNVHKTFEPICESMGVKVPPIAKAVQDMRAYLNVQRSIRNANKESVEPKARCGTDRDYGRHALIPDLSPEEMAVKTLEHYATLAEMVENRDYYERITRGQNLAKDGKWKLMRQDFVTASVIGNICKMRPGKYCANNVKQIRRPTVLQGPAIDHGMAMEFIAVQKLRDLGYEVEPCGLFLSTEYPGIGASPDGLIGHDAVVEIKCPFIGKDVPAVEAMMDRSTRISKAVQYKHGMFVMNPTHDYYYQVQCQMACSGRQLCFFVVQTLKTTEVIAVPRDDEFIEQMMTRAQIFYDTCLVPEIVDSRLERRREIREPQHILEAREAAEKEKEEKAQQKVARSKRMADKSKKSIEQTTAEKEEEMEIVTQNYQESKDNREPYEVKDVNGAYEYCEELEESYEPNHEFDEFWYEDNEELVDEDDPMNEFDEYYWNEAYELEGINEPSTLFAEEENYDEYERIEDVLDCVEKNEDTSMNEEVDCT